MSDTFLGTGNFQSEEIKISACRKLTFKGEYTDKSQTWKKNQNMLEARSAKERALRSTQTGGDLIYMNQSRPH